MVHENGHLSVRHLCKTFPVSKSLWSRRDESVRALDDVSLDVRPGESIGVVGGSGSGKSTLAKVIVGLITPDSGTVEWKGHTFLAMPPEQRAKAVQMIFQDPFASLNPKLSIKMQLVEATGVPKKGFRSNQEREAACVEALRSVGLSGDMLTRYPYQFSGGQRQRIAIARALLCEPELLIADEPLSALDVSIQAEIVALFDSLRKRLGLTFLFITHDLGVAGRQTDRLVVLQEGKVVEEGETSSVLRSPKHDYTRRLLEAVPRFAC